jgi:uncharacterized protein (TIGR01777 family)
VAIRESRVQGTTLLARTLASLKRPPSVLVSGSAIGYYGARTTSVCDETAPSADDILGEISSAWEAATAPAEAAGIRVVHARTGIVMGAAGGVLATQLPLFQLGLGGPIGRGQRWISPIALDDLIGALHWCCMREEMRGPVNLVAPTPVTNAEFTRTLARVLRRPAVAAVPPVVLRTVFGRDMAESTILASQQVVPSALLASGFAFRHPTLEAMLRFELGR